MRSEFPGGLRPGGRPLSRMDRYMLDFQRAFPTRPVSVAGCLLRLSGSPDLDQLRTAVLERVQAYPALTERLVARRGRAPRWEPGGTIDVTRHVREHQLPAGATEDDLRAAAGRLSGTVVPLDAPAWQVDLLTSPDTGEVQVMFRASHVWLDGLSQNRVLTLLFGERTAAEAGPGWVRTGTLTPGALAAAARRQATSWAGPSAELAALTGPDDGCRSVGWASVGVDRLRAVGQANGASVNDVYLVALGGALAAWTSPVGSSPVQGVVSISARRPGECAVLGNAFVATRVALPLERMSAAERFELVCRQTGPYKGGSDVSLADRFWSDRVPARFGRRTIGGGQEVRRAAVNSTNVGSIAGPLTVAGAPVTAAMPVPAAREGRRQVLVTLGVFGRTATAGFTLPAPGAAELADRWLAEVDDLERTAGIVPAPDQAVATLAAGSAPH